MLIIILILVIMFYNMYNKARIQAVHVPKHILHNIFKEGKYEGNADYGKTKIYPNGLNAKVTANIKYVRDGDVVVTNTIDAYHKDTGKHAYYATRIITYDYKPNHGENVFRNTKSYINGNLVSSSHGRIVWHNDNSIKIISHGSWHISHREFEISTIIDRNGDVVISKYINHGIIPYFMDLYLQENYKQIN
jgi:hypothetical protein